MAKFNVVQKRRRAAIADRNRATKGEPFTGKLKIKPQPHSISGKRKRKIFKKWRRVSYFFLFSISISVCVSLCIHLYVCNCAKRLFICTLVDGTGSERGCGEGSCHHAGCRDGCGSR